jgi:hypothetical protein
MPISYVLNKDQRRVHTRVTGSVTAGDILAHFHAARHEQALGFKELIDVRGVTPPFLSTTDIWRTAGMVRTLRRQEVLGPRAVVVGSELMFGMTRMFANLISDSFPIQVFRDPEQAEEWLADGSDSPDT